MAFSWLDGFSASRWLVESWPWPLLYLSRLLTFRFGALVDLSVWSPCFDFSVQSPCIDFSVFWVFFCLHWLHSFFLDCSCLVSLVSRIDSWALSLGLVAELCLLFGELSLSDWWLSSLFLGLVVELCVSGWLLSFVSWVGCWALSLGLVAELCLSGWLLSFVSWAGCWALSLGLFAELCLPDWLLSFVSRVGFELTLSDRLSSFESLDSCQAYSLNFELSLSFVLLGLVSLVDCWAESIWLS